MKKPRIKFKKGDKVWVPAEVVTVQNYTLLATSPVGSWFYPNEIRRRKP